MPIQRLAPQDFDAVPWKNGLGVSTTIAGACFPGHVPGDWSGVIWQFGRARIATPSRFSDLTGYDRVQIVIGGSGLLLETPDALIDVRVPFRPVRYDGGTPITSRLENGPVDVLNLIARREHCDIDLVCPIAGEPISLPAGINVVYAFENPAQLRMMIRGEPETDEVLLAGHALVLNGAMTCLPASGRVAIASISRK
ncbi:Uncharacterised protein family HutD/Ves [Rhabdaerophilaceae bacterium]